MLVMRIKQDYLNKFHDNEKSFEKWLEKLNDEEYNEFFSCLQVNQDEEFLLIRYGLAEMQSGMWQDKNSPYRECRSIVIDLQDDGLVATPFRKFFNLNEVEENKLETIIEEINNAKLFEASNKLDGSMQFVRYYKSDIRMFGSMALNKDNSWRLQDGYKMLTNNHREMVVKNPNLTFIFEYISLRDAHVVLYSKKQEGLYLIGIRDTTTGYEYSYKEVRRMANKYGIKMTEIEKLDLSQILEQMKVVKCHEKEGWVLNIDGHKIKVKCDDYCSIHKMLDKISSVNVIIQNVANGTFDDLISKIPETHRDRVTKIANKIQEWVFDTEGKIRDYYSVAPKDDIKTFMSWIDENVSKDISGYVKCKYLNEEYNLLKKRNGAYRKLKEMGIAESHSALFADLEI